MIQECNGGKKYSSTLANGDSIISNKFMEWIGDAIQDAITKDIHPLHVCASSNVKSIILGDFVSHIFDICYE